MVRHLNAESSQSYQISKDIFSIFINLSSVFKVKGCNRCVAVRERASQYGVFLILTILIHI